MEILWHWKNNYLCNFDYYWFIYCKIHQTLTEMQCKINRLTYNKLCMSNEFGRKNNKGISNIVIFVSFEPNAPAGAWAIRPCRN